MESGKPLTVLVLAAGMASRYGDLKQIDPIGPHGEILIDYSLYDALEHGFNKIVFVIRRDIDEDFREAIGSKFEGKAEVVYAYQELESIPAGFEVPADRRKPWGTTHAVLVTRDVIHEPFAVINADDYYGKSAYRKMSEFLRTAGGSGIPEYSMVGYVLRNTLSPHGKNARGICEMTSGGYVTSVVERKHIETNGRTFWYVEEDGQHPLSGEENVSMNFWGFTPESFTQLDEEFREFLTLHRENPASELYIPTAVDSLLRKNKARVRVLRSEDPWFGLTYKKDRPTVVEEIGKLIRQGVYPEKLWG